MAATSSSAPPSPNDTTDVVVTPFQRRVYELLKQIPEGKVTTYGALARALKSSPRAVGNALRNNPFAPQVPCHRCVAASGYVNGYDGEIIEKKTFSSSTAVAKAKATGVLMAKGKTHQSRARGAKARMQQSDSTTAGAATDGGSGGGRGGAGGGNISKKLDLLRQEGVEFDRKGMLLKRYKVLFEGPWVVPE